MEELDLRKIFQVFQKRKGLIFTVISVALLFALLISFFSPKIYEATGTLLVQEHKNEGSTRVQVDPQLYVNTQMELMKSFGVLTKVARQWVYKGKLSWALSEGEGERGECSVKDREGLVGENQLMALVRLALGSSQEVPTKEQQVLNLARELRERVSVTNKFGSNVFYIRAESDSAEVAAAVVNAVMVTYRQENLRLKREELENRLRRISELWKNAQYDWILTRKNVAKFLEESAPLLHTDFSKERTQLVQQKNALKRELSKLLSSYGKGHPRLKLLSREIAALERQIQTLDTQIRKAAQVKVELEKKQKTLRKKQEIFEKLDSKKKKLEEVLAELVSDAQISDFALVPDRPVKPKVAVNVAIAGVASTLFALALALFLEFISRKIKNEADLEKASGVRVITSLPPEAIQSYVGKVRELPEPYRLLRTSIMASLDEGEKSLLLVGTQKENDPTPFIATNLALAFSLLEEMEIILVDANLREPRCHEMFGLAITYGLVDYLIGALKDLNAKPTPQKNLKVITIGQVPPNPAELLESKRMRQVVQILEESSDIVIYCASSLAKFPDASVLAPLTKRTILTATADETSVEEVLQVQKILEHTKANIMGSVFCQSV